VTVMHNSSLLAISEGIISDSDPRQMQASSITFMQRFGSSINLNRHYHFIFLEGVYLDRSA
jgi:hypothetical protein